MARNWWHTVFRVGLFSLFGIVGCGKSEPPKPTTVRGTVTFQGRILAGGLIVFSPDREKGNAGKPHQVTIDARGGYILKNDITPGWYRIAIADPAGMPWEEYGLPKFPNALKRPDKSGIEREVIAGKDNIFLFEIEVPE